MTGSCPAAMSRSRSRITPGVVWPSIVTPTVPAPRPATAVPASRAIPVTAAAALSKIVREIGCSPRMSTTECITVVSDSPMNGPNARRPDALGETISFGTPTGSACIAPAPISAPSAPPRQSAPCSSPASYSRRQTARTPSVIRSTAAPREPAARIPSRSSPAAAATSARGTSAGQPASPRIPVSITTGRAPSAVSRSRTYATSSPLVSRVPISAIHGSRGTTGALIVRIPRGSKRAHNLTGTLA